MFSARKKTSIELALFFKVESHQCKETCTHLLLYGHSGIFLRDINTKKSNTKHHKLYIHNVRVWMKYAIIMSSAGIVKVHSFVSWHIIVK